jgi:glycosyltransferase involved in cell wall biosynthesis
LVDLLLWSVSKMTENVTLSIVIPVYNSADTIGLVVNELVKLDVPDGLEIVLVDDGSQDDSLSICQELVKNASLPITLVEHARNYGEHNAVLTGLRHTCGDYVITMDDDMQNPPSEVPTLLRKAQHSKNDVIYSYFEKKQHAAWRNIGSWLANKTASWVLHKPNDLYLSSFRCMSRFIVDQIIRFEGPFPYIDGLIFQSTNKVGSVLVEHHARSDNESSYTLSRLLRLWVSILINFSVLPLRAATVLGLVASVTGLLSVLVVFFLYLVFGTLIPGYYSTLLAILLFSGIQVFILGLLGEYLGHAYLTVNRKPQSVVRVVSRTGDIDK